MFSVGRKKGKENKEGVGGCVYMCVFLFTIMLAHPELYKIYIDIFIYICVCVCVCVCACVCVCVHLSVHLSVCVPYVCVCV